MKLNYTGIGDNGRKFAVAVILILTADVALLCSILL